MLLFLWSSDHYISLCYSVSDTFFVFLIAFSSIIHFFYHLIYWCYYITSSATVGQPLKVAPRTLHLLRAKFITSILSHWITTYSFSPSTQVHYPSNEIALSFLTHTNTHVQSHVSHHAISEPSQESEAAEAVCFVVLVYSSLMLT